MTIVLGEESAALGAPATFGSLGVPVPLVAALAVGGITAPFPIQVVTLPDALAGLDILGQGRTGSGKTLGYSLPLVARLADGRTAASRPRGLVLVPTRELASQVRDVLLPLASVMGLSVTVVFGGTAQGSQVTALRDRADIVVACPGRLADLIEQGHCHLDDVEVTVLDEADEMADLGFLPVVRCLLELTPADSQRMLFSATLDDAVSVLARRFLNAPARHTVDSAAPPAQITHHLLTISPEDRLAVVCALAGGRNRALVFTRTRVGARKLARQLAEAGIPAAELHGDLPQDARSRNLSAFSSGTVRVLVATDLASRGLHVDDIGLVIHADSPAEHKAYLHRAGRTARAGAAGVVITLQTPAQRRDVGRLMRRAGVIPFTAAAGPHSPVLRSIAGPPAERVRPAPRRGRPASGRRGQTGAGRDVRWLPEPPGPPQIAAPECEGFDPHGSRADLLDRSIKG